MLNGLFRNKNVVVYLPREIHLYSTITILSPGYELWDFSYTLSMRIWTFEIWNESCILLTFLFFNHYNGSIWAEIFFSNLLNLSSKWLSDQCEKYITGLHSIFFSNYFTIILWRNYKPVKLIRCKTNALNMSYRFLKCWPALRALVARDPRDYKSKQ